MATPWHHSVSSAKRWGGKPEDYLPIHDWFDATKEQYADFRHRALRHHCYGIYECERTFGTTITNSNGRRIPVRLIGEQHVTEDCGFIPTVSQWLGCIQPRPWMGANVAQIDDEGKTETETIGSFIGKLIAGAKDGSDNSRHDGNACGPDASS